ncbi:MAG TPA: thioredoxin domain-containing protein [Opitutaceae bacterium]|nr:thioredoxin domain-containing protein [Opitutaceae bacterium]
MHAANHLAGESSPYLLQHLHNPVDWYPWGDAAFGRARAENKPVFLSVGYSTCHWCHVMERECFEDEAVAALLNAHFVNVKVDREERPDVDRLHMTFLQASTGSGGWPMSVWLTPELKPFYAGTYFPPEDRQGMPGFKTILRRIAEYWEAQPERIAEQAEHVAQVLGSHEPASPSGAFLPDTWRDRGVRDLQRLFDPTNGGFDRAPKFPNAALLALLLDYQATGRDAALRDAARDMALTTLRKLVAGGIRDHLGGGFHRYTVDAHWRLPHFEKMLNDQAQLASACVDAWLIDGDPAFRTAAEECLGYLETRMRTPDGAFCTAEDADSPRDGEKHEGAYYLWTWPELRAVLGEQAATVFALAYGIAAEGNLGDEEEFAGRNLPYRAHDTAATAAACGLAASEADTILAAARARLLEERDRRPPPDRDDKILCGWNGLSLSALAKAAAHFARPRWVDDAARLAGFLRANLYDAATRRLFRSWRDGRRGPEAFAEDYSFVIQGLLDLFACTQESRWLEWALELQSMQDALFRDEAEGGYFASAAGAPHILVRMKSASDGAEPSASSIAVKNKARLAALLGDAAWRERARADAQAFGGTLEEVPLAMPQMLVSLGWLEDAPQQIVVVGEPDEAATQALLAEVHRRYLPRASLLVLHRSNREFFRQRAGYLADLATGAEEGARAFVCENFSCQLPVTRPEQLAELLDRRGTNAARRG